MATTIDVEEGESALRASPDRRVTCRYLKRTGNQCTGEVVRAEGEILLCLAHLGRALELVAREKRLAALR